MLILDHPITRAVLKDYAANTFGDMIKCVADVDKALLAIDADLHADLERMLLEKGSEQRLKVSLKSSSKNNAASRA